MNLLHKITEKSLFTVSLFTTSILLGILSSTLAQEIPADTRIRSHLEELGYEYEIEADGTFRVGMQLPNGRVQRVWIQSKTETFGTLEIRKILSPAYLSNSPFPVAVANQLLLDSASKKLGAWQMIIQDDQYLAIFSVKIPAHSNANELKDYLSAVVGSADGMEESLTGEDNF